MRRVSENTKIKQHRGTGVGKNYKPWIEVGEFGSDGTATVAIDWKTGRQVHLLSQTELYVWAILNWSNHYIDIREQFPLDINQTLKLADDFGIKHPSVNGKPVTMTTDLLLTELNGTYKAVSLKYSWNEAWNSQSVQDKLVLENAYWKQNNSKLTLIDREEINEILATNILDVTTFYNVDFFSDEISFLKYLIARKYIAVDMKTELLNYTNLLKEHKGEIEQWKNLRLISKTY